MAPLPLSCDVERLEVALRTGLFMWVLCGNSRAHISTRMYVKELFSLFPLSARTVKTVQTCHTTSIPSPLLSVKTLLTLYSNYVTLFCIICVKGGSLCSVATERPIDTKEVADMLGVTPRTVTRLAERGEIPGFKVGDVWRFHRQDILDYIEEQKQKRRPPSKE